MGVVLRRRRWTLGLVDRAVSCIQLLFPQSNIYIPMAMTIRIPFWTRKLGQLWRLVHESHSQPLAGTSCKPPQISPTGTSITFIGHSSFLIQTAGKAVLIDPVFATRLIVLRRQRRPGLRVADLPRIHAVLVTHAHMDHLNRPSLRGITREMRRRSLPAPIAIVPKGVEDLVHSLGFSRVETLDWWQSAQLKDSSFPITGPRLVSTDRDCALPQLSPPGVLSITATPARHWGARLFNDTHRGYGGYVIASSVGPTIYHSGDTAYFEGFAEIGRRMRPEIALLPIGAYFPDSYRSVHTSPEEALRAFIDLQADVMIPMHYGTFRLGREPMEEPLPRLLQAADNAGLGHRVTALEEGHSWITNFEARQRDGTG